MTQPAQSSHQVPRCSCVAAPVVAVADGLWPGEEVGLGIARRIDEAGDVPGVAEHNCAVASDELGRAVAALPRSEVVGQRARDVRVDRDATDVDRRSEETELAGGGEDVVGEDV
jgi:hypothetical protein